MDTPFWLEGPVRPVENKTLGHADVAIIGAGITGCSCALELARNGVAVSVHDERGIAHGASGRNGGFALRGGAAGYDVARESEGADAAPERRRRTQAALARLESLASNALR